MQLPDLVAAPPPSPSGAGRSGAASSAARHGHGHDRAHGATVADGPPFEEVLADAAIGRADRRPDHPATTNPAEVDSASAGERVPDWAVAGGLDLIGGRGAPPAHVPGAAPAALGGTAAPGLGLLDGAPTPRQALADLVAGARLARGPVATDAAATTTGSPTTGPGAEAPVPNAAGPTTAAGPVGGATTTGVHATSVDGAVTTATDTTTDEPALPGATPPSTTTPSASGGGPAPVGGHPVTVEGSSAEPEGAQPTPGTTPSPATEDQGAAPLDTVDAEPGPDPQREAKATPPGAERAATPAAAAAGPPEHSRAPQWVKDRFATAGDDAGPAVLPTDSAEVTDLDLTADGDTMEIPGASDLDAPEGQETATPIATHDADGTEAVLDLDERVESTGRTTAVDHGGGRGLESTRPTEAASANQRPADVAPARPMLPTRVPDAVMDALRRLRADGQDGATLRVRLDPPELGSVSVELVARGDQVSLVLRADQPGGAQALLDQRSHLEDLLADAGFDLDGFDVSTRDDQPSGDDGQDKTRRSATDPADGPVDGARLADDPRAGLLL